MFALELLTRGWNCWDLAWINIPQLEKIYVNSTEPAISYLTGDNNNDTNNQKTIIITNNHKIEHRDNEWSKLSYMYVMGVQQYTERDIKKHILFAKVLY